MQSRIRLRKTGTGEASFRHSRAIPTVMHVFEELDIAITLWNGSFWEELHERPDLSSLIAFELEHGAEIERSTYNVRSLQRVEKTKRAVLGRRGGFCDWFVPVCIQGRVDSVLVCGPFATERSSATDILERWRAITGRQGHPADPEFANYLAITLSTLVLEPRDVMLFQTLLDCLAKLIASEGNASRIAQRIDALHAALTESRMVEQMWTAARMMVDERSSRIWASPHRHPRRHRLGLTRFPERAVVGLFVSRQRGRDPVEDLLLYDSFQRKCAELAHKAGNMIAGQVGGHGVAFLGAGPARGDRQRGKLVEVAESAVTMARRTFGLDVYLGVGSGSRALTSDYQEALAAAEVALARGQKTVFASAGEAENPLGHLQRELQALVDVETSALPARFDRYLETVAVRHGYQLEPARVQLEAAFEPLAESILGRGALAGRAFSTFRADLHRSALAASTVNDLFAVYRRAFADLLETRSHPVAAGHHRNLRRAEEYMKQHYAEALTLDRVARVAGFAPAYFSVLFKKRIGVTFAHRLSELRLERAKQLLSRSDLNLARIAELSGLSNAHYLCRVFKRATGDTPARFRRKTDKLFTVGKTVGKKARTSGELTQVQGRARGDS